MIVQKKKRTVKKNLILAKASAMFREKGYPGSSMRDLAEAVGIEAASLYNHIESKAAILQEIIFKVVDDSYQHLERIDQPALSNSQKIESLIRFHVQMMLNRFDDYSVTINEWIHLSEPHCARFIAARRRYSRRMEEIIQEGIEQGEMKPVMPYAVMLSILSSVRGLEFWQRSNKKIPAQEMEDHIVTYLTSGLTL